MIPDNGFGYLGEEVRRKGVQFERAEIEAELEKYEERARIAVATGDWNQWADQFSEDAIYVEHQYGIFRGQKAIRDWICGVMQGQVTEMSFVFEFSMIDNDRVVLYVPNRYANPVDPAGEPYQFVALAILHYAGNGQWCYEEDIYNATESKRIHASYKDAKSAGQAS